MEVQYSTPPTISQIFQMKRRQTPIPGPLRLTRKTPSEIIRTASRKLRQSRNNTLLFQVLRDETTQNKFYENSIHRALIRMYKLFYTDNWEFEDELPVFLQTMQDYHLESRVLQFEPLRDILQRRLVFES